jgi:hypothetical protein
MAEATTRIQNPQSVHCFSPMTQGIERPLAQTPCAVSLDGHRVKNGRSGAVNGQEIAERVKTGPGLALAMAVGKRAAVNPP